MNFCWEYRVKHKRCHCLISVAVCRNYWSSRHSSLTLTSRLILNIMKEDVAPPKHRTLLVLILSMIVRRKICPHSKLLWRQRTLYTKACLRDWTRIFKRLKHLRLIDSLKSTKVTSKTILSKWWCIQTKTLTQAITKMLKTLTCPMMKMLDVLSPQPLPTLQNITSSYSNRETLLTARWKTMTRTILVLRVETSSS